MRILVLTAGDPSEPAHTVPAHTVSAHTEPGRAKPAHADPAHHGAPAHYGESAILASLDLLPHTVRIAPRDVPALLVDPSPDVVLVDARTDLAAARATCRMLHATGLGAPLLAVVTEAGLAAVSADWGIDDVIITTAGPAETEARLRLAVGRLGLDSENGSDLIRAGELSIDPNTYAARLKGRPLDLTYKEFELLKYLAQHPGRVFTRDQLLRDVWGYDYFGGTRTVDVHVRRLRAKLGAEHESMIGTVRQVGYKLVVPSPRHLPEPAAALGVRASRRPVQPGTPHRLDSG